MELVENVQAQRQLDVQNEKFGFISSDTRKGNFVKFFKAYINSKTRSECDNLTMSHRYFVEFAGNVLNFNELTDFLCEDYKQFLLSGPGIGHRRKSITKNTAVNYYAKFRSALKQAYKRELIAVDLHTPVKSGIVKRAALFAGLTGLRFSDVESLQWNEVRGSTGKYYMQFTRKKRRELWCFPYRTRLLNYLAKGACRKKKYLKGCDTLI